MVWNEVNSVGKRNREIIHVLKERKGKLDIGGNKVRSRWGNILMPLQGY